MSFVPYVVEQSAHGERSYDIFSRLLNDRIIVLSEDVNDIQATVYIPAALAAKLYAKLDEENCSRNELILKALREYLK